MSSFSIEKVEKLKLKVEDASQLGFGKVFTDYMAQVDYSKEEGWHNPRIKPYENLSLSPANISLHYGQLIFEGMKAYKNINGDIVLFRPEENIKRLNRSAARICIPQIDEGLVLNLIEELVLLEKDWIPSEPGCSLYIRPFVIATEPYIGVRPSETYSLFIILSPVGSYYAQGMSPIDIFVEDEYVRAVKGGTGEAKCAGNYAASLAAQMKAAENGYTQVMWLDGIERKYIEEVGTSNAFFVIDGKVITPPLNGSILPGITRDSTIKLLKHLGFDVEERPITIDELLDAYNQGRVSEAFATGTATIASPIGKLKYKDTVMDIAKGQVGAITNQVYENLLAIQTQKQDDPFGWVKKIN